jgi:ABC-type uncharacterized transport system permease subunit
MFGANLMLNLMINHRLADVICNSLIGTLTTTMICFKAFCFICKSFHSRPFFFLKKKNFTIYFCASFLTMALDYLGCVLGLGGFKKNNNK